MRLTTILFFLVFLAAGCLNTRNEKIELQSERTKRKVEERALRLRPKTFQEEAEAKMVRSQRLEVSYAMWKSERRRDTTRRAIARAKEDIAEDPFESYELERARVLDRPWTDTKGK